MTTTFQFAFPWPCGNTFKPSLEMNHALTDADLQRLTGGYRTDEETCEKAQMEWSEDQNTVEDGLGRCSLPPGGWSYV